MNDMIKSKTNIKIILTSISLAVVILIAWFLYLVLFKSNSNPATNQAVIKSISISSLPNTVVSSGDLWFSTWAENNNIYMSWGDGCGLGSTITDKNCSEDVEFTDSGIAEIKESISSWGSNFCVNASCVRYRHVPTGLVPFPLGNDRDDKPSSLLYLNEKLYLAGHTPADPAIRGYLAYSQNLGRSWTEIPNSPWNKESQFKILMFVQMGQNYSLNNDGYVYALGIDKEFNRKIDKVYLTRVKKNLIEDYKSYQYYAGKIDNEISWSTDQKNAVAISGLKTKSTGSSIYHEGIGRYLFLTTETEDNPKASLLTLYESADPWGPWIEVGRVKLSKTAWESGYQPGLIAKDAGSDYVYFTLSGDAKYGKLPYQLNIGRINFEINKD